MKYIRQVMQTVKKESPILYTIVWMHFIMAMGSAIGLLIDDRILMGVNVWIKPLKFTVSSGIYILTLGFLITFYPFSRLKKHIVRNIVSWTLLFEILIIVVQGARGVLSHYNVTSALNGMLFGMMGLLIAINVLVMVFFIIETIRLKLNTARSVQWAILLGWIIVLFGSWIGSQMIAQLGHNVGVADGGDGLPLLNWSTVAGDLRVAHFFGLHSIQLLPLLAYVLFRKWNAPQRTQITTMILTGLLYASWVGYVFYQAKREIPFLHI